MFDSLNIRKKYTELPHDDQSKQRILKLNVMVLLESCSCTVVLYITTNSKCLNITENFLILDNGKGSGSRQLLDKCTGV